MIFEYLRSIFVRNKENFDYLSEISEILSQDVWVFETIFPKKIQSCAKSNSYLKNKYLHFRY